MQTQYITSSDGHRIAYDVSGQGPGLLLLHGAGKTRLDWHTLGYVERLKAEFTVVASWIVHGSSQLIVGTGDSTGTRYRGTPIHGRDYHVEDGWFVFRDIGVGWGRPQFYFRTAPDPDRGNGRIVAEAANHGGS